MLKVILIVLTLLPISLEGADPQDLKLIKEFARNPKPRTTTRKPRKKQIETFNLVLTPLLKKNNVKKTKKLYGRHHRNLDDNVQFALDIRFGNYDHALKILDDQDFDSEEEDFWERILKAKPKNVSKAVCEELASQQKFPEAEVDLGQLRESKWKKVLDDLIWNLASPKRREKQDPRVKSFVEKLNTLECQDKNSPETGFCPPLTAEQQEVFLKQEFMDPIRNAQRRSSRIFEAYRKKPVKLIEDPNDYNRFLLVKLDWSIRGTDSKYRNRYLKRLRGIAKDMRKDSVYHRQIGSMILRDYNDVRFMNRVRWLLSSRPVLAVVNGLNLSLPSCKLPSVGPFRP